MLLYKDGLRGAVDRLLDAPPFTLPAPEGLAPRDQVALRQEAADLPEAERLERRAMLRREENRQITQLRSAWLQRMLATPHPLQEKLTLFWHGHFATSMVKVQQCYHMWMQNNTFRSHALGNFGELVAEMTRDPAMMIWLDVQQNSERKPNENFARELMELFTLGEGHYTEEDIRESARAFTGYRIDSSTQQFQFISRRHDDGLKTFRQQKGRFDGDDIVRILLEDTQCAEFITGKLWRFFVNDRPAPGTVESLARRFHRSGYELRPLMREIFLSEEFYSKAAIGTQIKSPVQWLVGTAAAVGLDSLEAPEYQSALRQMGQTLFQPPNVKGWDGGKSWISTSTLLFRYNLAGAIVKGTNIPGMRRLRGSGLSLDDLAPPELRTEPSKLIRYLTLRLYQQQVPEKESASFFNYLANRDAAEDEKMAGLIHLMMSTPRYQLA